MTISLVELQDAVTAFAGMIATIGAGCAGVLRIAKGYVDKAEARHDAALKQLHEAMSASAAKCEKANEVLENKLATCEEKHDKVAKDMADARVLHERELSELRRQVDRVDDRVKRLSPQPMQAVKPEGKKP